jgi:pilus assembly protein CpaE
MSEVPAKAAAPRIGFVGLGCPKALVDRPYDLDPASCDSVIDVVRESVPWVAVDVPHLWTAWAKQVVQRAFLSPITRV